MSKLTTIHRDIFDAIYTDFALDTKDVAERFFSGDTGKARRACKALEAAGLVTGEIRDESGVYHGNKSKERPGSAILWQCWQTYDHVDQAGHDRLWEEAVDGAPTVVEPEASPADQPSEEEVARRLALVEEAAASVAAQAAAAQEVERWEARVKIAAQAVVNARMALAEAKAQLADARRAAKPARASRADGERKVVAEGEVIQRSKARTTGVTTSVTRLAEGWRMACLDHGAAAERRNRLVAEAEARHPEAWCPACTAAAAQGATGAAATA